MFKIVIFPLEISWPYFPSIWPANCEMMSFEDHKKKYRSSFECHMTLFIKLFRSLLVMFFVFYFISFFFFFIYFSKFSPLSIIIFLFGIYLTTLFFFSVHIFVRFFVSVLTLHSVSMHWTFLVLNPMLC